MSHVSTARCSVHYVMHNFIPSALICAECKLCSFMYALCMPLHNVVFLLRTICVCVCVFVYVTWPCQSIFQCRPFHRQLPAPDPEIQWPHPQTAASASMHTHKTCILHYGLRESSSLQTQKAWTTADGLFFHFLVSKTTQRQSCCRSVSSSASVSGFMWTQCH